MKLRLRKLSGRAPEGIRFTVSRIRAATGPIKAGLWRSAVRPTGRIPVRNAASAGPTFEADALRAQLEALHAAHVEPGRVPPGIRRQFEGMRP